MRVGRVTVEILAPVPIAPLTLSASVVRPGRSVEMLEASLRGPDGDVMRARAWRLATAEITADWEQEEPPLGPEDATALEFFATGERVGWHTAMEIIFARGEVPRARPRDGLDAPARGARGRRGVHAAPARDGGGRRGNGVSAPLDWSGFIFINTDLTVHCCALPSANGSASTR